MVKVACKIVNGLMIHKWRPGFDDGTGQHPLTHDGPGIRLNGASALGSGVSNPSGAGLEPGFTEIDDDWGFDTWLEQNKQNPFVGEGLIYVVNEDGTPKKTTAQGVNDPNAP